MKKIPVYVINLEARKDRLENIKKQFLGRTEFDLNIIKACENEIGAVGLWQSIHGILKNSNDEMIIICEDDHEFTEHYELELLNNSIALGMEMDVDIMLGGVSWFSNALQISANLFWIQMFSGLQFSIVYKKFFKRILEADFGVRDAADIKISALTEDKMLIYPFISTQKEFGYSDVTSKNNEDGYVTQIFSDSSEKLGHLQKVGQFYGLEF